MFFGLFQSKYARNKDNSEIARILRIYGDGARQVVHDRIINCASSARNREHWKRIARNLK
jgi:hypothetical protein